MICSVSISSSFAPYSVQFWMYFKRSEHSFGGNGHKRSRAHPATQSPPILFHLRGDSLVSLWLCARNVSDSVEKELQPHYIASKSSELIRFTILRCFWTCRAMVIALVLAHPTYIVTSFRLAWACAGKFVGVLLSTKCYWWFHRVCSI